MSFRKRYGERQSERVGEKEREELLGVAACNFQLHRSSWPASMAASPHECGFGKLMRREISPLSPVMTGPTWPNQIRSLFFFFFLEK